MAVINILDIKNKRKKIDPITNNIVDVESPTVTSPKRTINIADVKSGKVKLTSIIEEQDNIGGQELANKIMGIVKDTAKTTSDALTTKQNKVENNIPKQKTQEEILSDLKNSNTNQINQEGYTDTGKKFGDYYYHEYKTKGQYKIYSKDNQYYYYDEQNKKYVPFTGRESWMTTKEDDEKAYQEAVKAGYKDNSIKDKDGNYLSIENQLKLDTTDLTNEERKQYTEDLFRQQKNKEEENAVQYGGPGLKGSISELQRMGKNIQENLIEPIGRSAENYQYGELNRQLGLEAYKEMMGEKNNLKEIQDKLYKYQKFNEDIISSQNIIDQNTQNLPNQVSGMVEGIKGAGVLGTLGAIGGGLVGAVTTKTPQGALVGAEKGAKLLGGAGYTGAQAKSTYELEAGYAYQAMIEMGVPKEIAKEEAQKVGTTNAVIESGETLLDMITMGKASQITSKIGEGLAKKYGLETVRNWAKKGVGSYLTNIASEGAEEALQEYSSIQGEKRATKKAGIQRDDSADLERIKSSAIAGAFGGAVGGAVTRPAGIITNRATNNIINNVSNKVSKNRSTSASTQSPIVSNQNNLKDVTQSSIANTVNSFNLGKNIQTVKTNQTFKQSARNYNIDVNNETINSIDKMLSQRGIKARFDSNAFIGSNENAFWQLNKDGSRKVVFNPNAKTNDLLENVAVHELYHDIFKSKDGQNIKDELLDFAKTKEGYNEARKSLEQLYSNKYDPNSDEFNAFIDEEAVASILGKKLGNQEFVSSLTVEKPSVAKSVYNWVVDKLNKLNKLTGYKSEKLFWKDIKNKFDSAYRNKEQYIGNSNNRTRFHINQNLSKNIDNVLTNIKERNPVKLRDYTPDVLVKNGIKNLPMYENPSHIRKNILKKEEAKNIGLSVNSKDHYHGLGKEIYIKAIDSLDDPRVIFKNKNNKDYLILTMVKDKNNNNVIVPIEIETKTDVNKVSIDINRVKSIYGYNKTFPNLNQYIKYNIKNSSLVKIYEQKKQSTNIASQSAFSKNNISDSNQNVKSDTRYSMQHSEINAQNNNEWQNFVDKNFKNEGTGHTLSQVKTNRTLNPTEIANLTKEDASTTPKLPNVPVQKGDKQSKFTKNIAEKTKMLTEENRMKLSTEDDISYYKGITNKQSLDEAYSRLNDGGSGETLSWLSRNSFDKNGKLKQKPTATDVAEGWILLKQYQDAGDYDSMVQVAKVMRQMGTEAGQAVQAYNIMSRLTPEGMVKYAQSELDEAYNRMIKNKTKQWIDKNRDKFTLTPDETAYIVDKIKEASQLPDGYDKKVKLAQIQSLISNKLPPARGAGIKAWMRISMLFNAKTQIRNIMGNAVITPVNAISDTFSALVDRQVAKKTGVRTTGVPNVKNYAKGFKKGLYESYNDFKLDINTRDMQGNRFEIGEGKSFSNRNKIGKALNQTDRVLSFMLDAGDRPFYEATFINSVNNQKILNNTDTVTQDMIDIATTEALQRTWQDNNEYTKFVLNTRRGLNKANIKGYGIGDALIPFAKTPANLTKALVDYSPAGLVTTLVEGNKLKNAIETGSFTPQMQHKFVQNLGKAMAGSFLYILGYALAKNGITTGANDDDKDIANFMKNTLGIQPYSIKIGNHSFTYDWAQPVSTPFAIMSNYVKYSEENPEASVIDRAINAMNIGTEQLLEQSFMESLNTVLNGNGKTLENLSEAILELPSRAVPTFIKQINDMIDTTQRTPYESDEPIETAKNKVKNKIPGLSKDLAPSRDSLGREIKKYGGDVNIFNVFFNPANTSKGKVSESAKEIYKIYQETGDKTIMPRVAPYSIMNGGEKVSLTSKERSEFQKISGQIVEKNVKELVKTSKYKKLDDSYKAEAIKGIVDYSYNYAKSEILDQPISRNFKKAYEYTQKGGALYDFYADKVYKNSKEK